MEKPSKAKESNQKAELFTPVRLSNFFERARTMISANFCFIFANKTTLARQSQKRNLHETFSITKRGEGLAHSFVNSGRPYKRTVVQVLVDLVP